MLTLQIQIWLNENLIYNRITNRENKTFPLVLYNYKKPITKLFNALTLSPTALG
jgi:hypothetical protein